MPPLDSGKGVAWVRLDDGFARHPKLAQAGPLGMAMQVAALCYCNRELTDGFVPRSVARTLLDFTVEDGEGRLWSITRGCGMMGDDITPEWIIDLLLEAGVWEHVAGGYRIHDYHDYQPSKEQVLHEREGNRKRQAAWRERNAVTNDVTNAPVTDAPYPYPVPVPDPIPGPLGGGADAPPAPKKTKRSQVDPKFDPGLEEWGKLMRELAYTEDKMNYETDKFIDHFLGTGEVKADWTAAWRNWLRRSHEGFRRAGR